MTLAAPSHQPSWLARLEASRHRLALLSGPCDVRVVFANTQQMAPNCALLNLSLALSQRLLDVPSRQRPAQAPVILAELLAGKEPVMLYDIELLFEPTLQLEPLRALKAASRSRMLLALWPGTFEGGSLTHAEPGHPEYKRYSATDLADILVMPATELTPEA